MRLSYSNSQLDPLLNSTRPKLATSSTTRPGTHFQGFSCVSFLFGIAYLSASFPRFSTTDPFEALDRAGSTSLESRLSSNSLFRKSFLFRQSSSSSRLLHSPLRPSHHSYIGARCDSSKHRTWNSQYKLVYNRPPSLPALSAPCTFPTGLKAPFNIES